MQLPKAYNPADHEADIYKLWEESGAFEPRMTGKDGAPTEPFTIIMPPPNANAGLHAGHVLFIAIQDLVTRYQRLQGKAALWLPGADHAGFETWVVYEKHLAKEGKSRFDFSREELYQQVWDFVDHNKQVFFDQFRAMGASCDWSRFTFTLDEKIVKTAYATFKKMWDDDLIYRGERIVNYCTHHGTSFSDYEVVYKEAESALYYVNYPLVDGSGSVTIATTRPETILGDVAVAVHPEDKKNAANIGKTVRLPLTNREIPIVADDIVDREFGTGAVKITPAHDLVDFELGQRHNLPSLTVIDHEGKINHNAPEKYQGMGVDEARGAIVAALDQLGALAKVEHYTNSVAHCYKCDTIIQPLLKDQWFVSMQPLATRAIAALESGDITFYPASKKQAVITYLKNIKDWNISRQIAWGIPIPAFRSTEDSEKWIFDERVSEETIEVDGVTYTRDPDVFDTWWSSDQWPYATLGHPDSDDYRTFFPTSLMETGGEILFVWVTRMIMMSLYVTGQVPFKEVYIHGNVKAEDGTKMSKSKGNTIDPMGLVKEFGSDALRIGTLSGRTAGSHQAYTPAKVVGGRNFANKLWNIARYVQGVTGEDFDFHAEVSRNSIADHWILSRIDEASKSIAKQIDEYQFALALERVHSLVWEEFADWYIEASKTQPNPTLLGRCLEAILTITHPFAPFVTEAIWQSLGWEKSMIITHAWPQVAQYDASAARDFDIIRTLVTEARAIASNMRLSRPTMQYATSPLISNNVDLITQLAKLGSVEEKTGNGIKVNHPSLDAWINVTPDELANFKKQFADEKQRIEDQIQRLKSRLSNKNYISNAPDEVVASTKTELSDAEARLSDLQDYSI